jgi:hypothetical protein
MGSRNIVPLMLESFEFGTPTTASQLTGKLAVFKEYNGLEIPKAIGPVGTCGRGRRPTGQRNERALGIAGSCYTVPYVIGSYAAVDRVEKTVSEFTKEGLAIDVDGRIRSPRVIEVLSRLVSERGAPLLLRATTVPSSFPRRSCPGSPRRALAPR